MLKHRIVATLLTDGRGNCVKTKQFSRPYRMCGPLLQHVKVMNSRDVDELIIIDINATSEGREPNYRLIEQCARQCYMPLTVGGGIHTLQHAITLTKTCGADKILIQSMRVPIIKKVSEKLGEQSVCFALDCDTHWENSIDNYLDLINDLPVGEVVLTYTPNDGMSYGYNTELIGRFTRGCSTPVVASGGCGHPRDMIQGLEAGASAVAAGSMFLFTAWTPRAASQYVAEHSRFPVRL